MEGGAIVRSHHCILLIRVTTFIDADLYFTIKNIVHWRGSTSRIETLYV